MNKRTLEQVRDNGCKVLHLTPKMFNLHQNQPYFLLEDENYRPIKLNMTEMKALLTPPTG